MGGILTPIRKSNPLSNFRVFLLRASDITPIKTCLDSQRWADPVPTRIGRKIPNDGPVMDPSSPDIACNVGGEDGTDGVFDVNAGSDITFQWNTVRPSAPTLRPPLDLLLCYWLITVAYLSPGSCHNSHGILQRRLFHIQGHR